MAFPTVSQIVNSRQTSPVNNHPVAIPSGLEPGSVLLLVEFCHGNLDLAGHPTGFQILYHAPPTTFSGNVNIQVVGYVWKPAILPILGVERGDRSAVPGGTITLTTNLARRSDVYAIAFAEKDMPFSYFKFAQSGGGATVVDPPNLAYSASAKDVLWWVLGTTICVAGQSWSSFPANYTMHQGQHSFNPGSFRCGLGARELNAASEDPGAFAPTGNSDWYGVTMGIALDGP